MGAGVVGATTWVAPSIIGVSAAAAATCDPNLAPSLTMGSQTSFVVPTVPGNTSTIVDSTPDAAIPPSPISFVWLEQGPVTLAAPVQVNGTGLGTYVPPTAASTLPTVPTGTTVFSYYVHTRRLSTLSSAYFAGSLVVPTGYEVVGMALATPANTTPPDPVTNASGLTNTLRTTDGLALPGLTYRYNTNGGEGLEAAAYTVLPIPAYMDGRLRDTVVIDSVAGGTRVRWYTFTGGTFSDDLRLLVAADC